MTSLRNEYKYLVPEDKLDALRRAIAPFVEMDHYASDRAGHQYTVRSIYFDRPELPFYQEKIDGIERRKKIRIRGYNQLNHQTQVFLEIKRKYGVLIEKQRAPVYHRHLSELFNSREIDKYVIIRPGFDHAAQDAQRFFFNVTVFCPRPVVLIVYQREAYFCKFNRQLRLTFDKQIHCRHSPGLDLFSDDHLRPVFPRYFIFEIKFDRGLPQWIPALVRDLDLRRQAFSKYTTCLDNGSPLPHDPLKKKHIVY